MSEYRKLTAEECADILLNAKNPLILCHIRPDGDTVGSAKALAILFSMLGKRAKIACADEIPERLKFILDEDDAHTGSTDGYTHIAIDVASASQLGSLAEVTSPILAIDHHAVSTPFCDDYTVPEASSAAEALMDVIEVLIKRGLISLTPTLAYPLYAAISSDSGCFCYSNVTPRTHLRAAELIATGIDFSDINHRLFHSKSSEQLRAEALVGSRVKTLLDGVIAYAVITEEDRQSIGIGKEHFECAIDVVRTLRGAEIAATVKEMDNGTYKISLRSTGPNVAEVAATFGGGGHIRAAGCSITASSAEEATKLLLSELIKIYET